MMGVIIEAVEQQPAGEKPLRLSNKVASSKWDPVHLILGKQHVKFL